MTIDKLPSGAYRIRKTVKGKAYSVTVRTDKEPTQSAALLLISAEIERKSANVPTDTLKALCEAYKATRSNICSPSTLKGYATLIRCLPEPYASMKAKDITAKKLQELTNEYAATHSPKSTANMLNFIQAVLKENDVQLRAPTLPKNIKEEPYIPTPEEVGRIFERISGTKYEVPIYLATMGLRRSEICALRMEDLDGCVLTIRRALVPDEHSKLVEKSTKTAKSTRVIKIPPELADLIRQQGYFYNGHPELITRTLKEVQEELGIKHFTLHKLRHFFASYMMQCGFTQKQIQGEVGWSTMYTMTELYQHMMDMDAARSGMAEAIRALMPKK